jgi:hypothetical protein
VCHRRHGLGPLLTAAVNGGMKSVDTLWYHLPQATWLHYMVSEPVTVFYRELRASSRAGHAGVWKRPGLRVPQSWLARARAPFRVVHRTSPRARGSTLLGVAVVLALPSLVTTQPGGAYNNAMG